jgi:hypothetical protein
MAKKDIPRRRQFIDGLGSTGCKDADAAVNMTKLLEERYLVTSMTAPWLKLTSNIGYTIPAACQITE